MFIFLPRLCPGIVSHVMAPTTFAHASRGCSVSLQRSRSRPRWGRHRRSHQFPPEPLPLGLTMGGMLPGAGAGASKSPAPPVRRVAMTMVLRGPNGVELIREAGRLLWRVLRMLCPNPHGTLPFLCRQCRLPQQDPLLLLRPGFVTHLLENFPVLLVKKFIKESDYRSNRHGPASPSPQS